MKLNQIYAITNTMAQQVIGETAVLAEDLSNLVDIGQQLNVLDNTDKIFKVLADQIARIVFVDRLFEIKDLGLMMSNHEYGSIIEKVKCELYDATENGSWELTDGESYDQNKFVKPKITATFWDTKVTFEVPMSSITSNVLNSAFRNIYQLNALFSTIENSVRNSMTIRLNALAKSVIGSMIAKTVKTEYADEAITTKTTIKARNLLKEFNDANNTTLTPAQAITNKDFLIYAIAEMSLQKDRFTEPSTLFNIDGLVRETPAERFKMIALDVFTNNVKKYLQSNVFNKELLELPQLTTVSSWQGSGTTYSFDEVSKIIVKPMGETENVTVTGVLAVMRDINSCGIEAPNQHVTSHYNAAREFLNQWYKYDSGYFNALDENFVVFFIA